MEATTVDGLRAGAVLAAALAMGLLGTPGLDGLKATWLEAPEARAAWLERAGPAGWLAVGATEVNRRVRRPLTRALGPIQRPLAMEQSWFLYVDGPGRVWRLEVWVDGVLRHRSGDPEHAWRDDALSYRRMRPLVAWLTRGRSARHWKRTTAWVVAQARADWPEAREVELVSTASPFPGTSPEVVQRIRAMAPAWEAFRTREGEEREP